MIAMSTYGQVILIINRTYIDGKSYFLHYSSVVQFQDLSNILWRQALVDDHFVEYNSKKVEKNLSQLFDADLIQHHQVSKNLLRFFH